jgi:ribulose-5-phosphate 4-epimerase/fuculose-1-phosphate aldolase
MGWITVARAQACAPKERDNSMKTHDWAAGVLNRRRFLEMSLSAAGGLALGIHGIARGQSGPSSAGPAAPSLIEDLVAANRILVRYGVLDGMGHVSVRHNLDPSRFLISRSRAPVLVTADDILEYDLDGRAVDLRGRDQYSERFIHAAVYAARPDVNAVVHNHSPAVIPFTVSDVPLRPIYHMASFMREGLPIFDIRDEAGITNMLVNSPERARALVKVLGDNAAVLMRGHGIVVTGPAIPYAVGRSIYTQINADLELKAISLGGHVEYLDPREAQAMLDDGENRGYGRSWELWKRDALAEIHGAAGRP